MKAVFYFFFLSFILESTCSASSAVEDTCKQVVDSEHYDFCVKTLSSNPKGKSVKDRKDLARIASDFALLSFKTTNAKIDQMVKQKGTTEQQDLALEICRDSFAMGYIKLAMVMPYYEKGGVDQATNYVYAALDKLQSCIDAFVKTGVQSKLAKENDEAVSLLRLISKLMHLS